MFQRHGLSLGRFIALHLLVALSLFALWGWVETGNRYLLLATAASLYGALCFAFAGLYRLRGSRSAGLPGNKNRNIIQ